MNIKFGFSTSLFDLLKYSIVADIMCICFYIVYTLVKYFPLVNVRSSLFLFRIKICEVGATF